ncbi:MAG TPA: MGMT family protein [Candidatus Omnitrophota bacterium]|nr:MGMT family protein [Candidatus Omnitrophota bacterium]HPS20431.1 MGMT family protein [Candidatus Omnitrophota bacterium]
MIMDISHKIDNDKILTAFQKKVLRKTLEIPRGEVRSYGWIAREIGCTAYRAVGMALHRNPYAPFVPCHRVISSDGSIGGYAGGINKKIRTLKKEGVLFRYASGRYTLSSGPGGIR